MSTEGKMLSDHTVKVDPFTVGLFATFQVTVVLLYAFVVDFPSDQVIAQENPDLALAQLYPFFQDVHVMIFIGFGCVMAFMRRYSLSSLGFTSMLAAAMMLWTILVVGFWHRVFGELSFHEKIQLKTTELFTGDFGAGCVLISFGAVIGKAGPAQLLVMGILEAVFYGLNATIGVVEYKAVDHIGGAMFFHMFGGFFGVAASRTFMNVEEVRRLDRDGKSKSSRTNDTIAMIGSMFLFLFWPSINSAMVVGPPRMRVVVHTVLGLSASCMAGIMASYALRGGRFAMADVQNATLAGGVAVGSCAALVENAWTSVLIGMLAGVVSVLGFLHLTPAMERFGLHDTCSILTLHGVVGILGAVSGTISAAAAGTTVYGSDISLVFPARADGARSASDQAGMQAAAMFTTLGISLVGGALTGLVMRLVPNAGDARFEAFEDARWWAQLADEADEEARAKLELRSTEPDVEAKYHPNDN